MWQSLNVSRTYIYISRGLDQPLANILLEPNWRCRWHMPIDAHSEFRYVVVVRPKYTWNYGDGKDGCDFLPPAEHYVIFEVLRYSISATTTRCT